MTVGIGRRQFIVGLSGAAAARPIAARAQQSAIPMIGLLASGSANGVFVNDVAAFRNGLNEAGYGESRQVTIEFRWAEGQYDRLPALAADLVQRHAAVIVAAGGAVTALAAKAATTTIPVVFVNGNDPVKFGLVESLNRPGGNLTGVITFSNVIETKRLELLHQVVPTASVVAVLANPSNADISSQLKALQTAAQALDLQLVVLNAATASEIDAAYASLAERRANALLVCSDSFFAGRVDQLVALSAHQAIPTMYWQRELPLAGGLMSYGNSFPEAYRQAGIYVGRILKGEKPADIPVLQSTKFELVMNLKTASVLGLTIPPNVLAIADEVIN
jgi:putative tryptophan/tyrosine transport system substrate-binding protein